MVPSWEARQQLYGGDQEAKDQGSTYSHIRQDCIHGEAWIVRLREIPERTFSLRFGRCVDSEGEELFGCVFVVCCFDGFVVPGVCVAEVSVLNLDYRLSWHSIDLTFIDDAEFFIWLWNQGSGRGGCQHDALNRRFFRCGFDQVHCAVDSSRNNDVGVGAERHVCGL